MPGCLVYCSYVNGLRCELKLYAVGLYNLKVRCGSLFVWMLIMECCRGRTERSCTLRICASFGSTRLICASFGSTRLIRASFGSTRLICASLGITRLIGVSFGITRLIRASFGITRLTCAFYGTTRLLCRVRVQRGADRQGAGRMREGDMDASVRVWRALVAGYEPSMITIDGVSIPKSEVDWTNAEEQASVGNAKALNAIFNGVDLNVFRLINSCSSAKEAWKILEVAYEGTTKFKISRLQLVTLKFKVLKMSEDEYVSEYNERVLEIANESLPLGENIFEYKITCKVLRSLPGKFDMKVTTIKEAHDITKLKLDELFGSLLTFEMAISHRENKKGMGVAFISIFEEESTVNQSESEANVNESIALLTK
ncbi:gag-pol polyprotein [Cucumis melo var. makuwa]|uniref:Gag-pol polyprotein n=1 Tax=Cucumis melo var. makuwa TaxID=1194695 RepID=A0A5A7UZ95_CUCMM|nr:gag-pol polyprotein [Cucumis melo var. makuwa]